MKQKVAIMNGKVYQWDGTTWVMTALTPEEVMDNDDYVVELND